MYAQNITLKQNNISLEKVINEIRKQCGCHFLYNTYVIKKAYPVSIDIKDATLESVLIVCFKDQPLTYYLVRNTVIIRQKGEKGFQR